MVVWRAATQHVNLPWFIQVVNNSSDVLEPGVHGAELNDWASNRRSIERIRASLPSAA